MPGTGFTRTATRESPVEIVQRGIVHGAQVTGESRYGGARRKAGINELVVITPAVVGDDFARFLVRNGRVIVPSPGGGVNERWPGKRRVLPVEITDERQVHRRFTHAVEINADMPGLGCGGPDAPDHARPVHLGEDLPAVFTANDAVAIPIGVPSEIFPGRLVILAGAIVARPLFRGFPRRRQGSEMLQIGQALDEVRVAQRRRRTSVEAAAG